MSVAPDYDSALSFLRLLYGGAQDGCLAIWSKQTKRTEWFNAADLEAVAHFLASRARQQDCYFGVGLQTAALGPLKRGEADTVGSMPGTWLDVDVLSAGAHAQVRLPRSREQALQWLNSLDLPPTAIVDTGHGLHAYWLFDKPYQIDSQDNRAFAQKLARDWQSALLSKARAEGWHLDNTADLARVLRPPGTLNHKLVGSGETEPRPVKLLHAQVQNRYSVEQIRRHTEDVAAQSDAADDQTGTEIDQAPADLGRIVEGCAFLRHARDDAATLPEPAWLAMLSIVGRTENGTKVAHEWSRPYPRYSASETDAKFEAALSKAGPWTCATIREKAGAEEYCAKCPYSGRIKSPISLGRGVLAEVAARYAYVVGIKRFVDSLSSQMLDKEQLDDRWAAKSPYKKSLSKVALKSSMLTVLDNPTFLPGGEPVVEEGGQRLFNLWRPPTILPVPGDTKIFIAHMEYIFPNEADRNHVLSFMAHMVQKPAQKIHHALVVQGVQGTGKSFLGQAMRAVLGGENVVMLDTSELASSYNGYLKRAHLVVIEEMMAFGRKELMNKLKPLITEPQIRINEKFLPQYTLANRANFLILSNHEDAVLLEATDRRYFIAQSPAVAQAKEYYDCLFGFLRDCPGVLLNYLRTRDIGDFKAKAPPPVTDAKRAVIESSRPALEAYLAEQFAAQDWPFTGDLAIASDIADALHRKFGASTSQVAKILKKLGGVSLGQKRMKDKSKPTVWAMCRPDTWRTANETLVADHCKRPLLGSNGEQQFVTRTSAF